MKGKSPRVLVAYGSTRGGTREIAAAIAETMLNEGVDAELADAAAIRNLDGYDAIVLGGALYMHRWHRSARKLLTRHADELRAIPVWLFSSGPLGHDANERELPSTAQVTRLVEQIGARDHVTFGGRLSADARGPAAAAMAKKVAGDWRDWHKIRAWAKDISRHVLAEEPRKLAVAPEPSRRQRTLLAALCLFTGITAIGGGATLAIRPDGSLLEVAPSALQHSPFATFLIPGLLLLAVVGLGNAIAGISVARNSKRAPILSTFAGVALLVWITAEMLMLRTHRWMQVGYLLVATVILIETWRLFAIAWPSRRKERHALR
jgi:menaquinone-dependent protoporphyrinogen oxidase